MSIKDSRDENLDVSRDVKRHHEKIRRAVKRKLPEILSEEEIITSDNRGKKIRIPIKSMDIPDLRRGKRTKDKDNLGSGKSGIGQGSGDEGDPIDPKQGEDGDGSKGGAGTGGRNEDVVEGEFTLDELIEMMFEDLGLPDLLMKEMATIELKASYKLKGSERVGPMVLLKKRPTAKNAMRNFWGLMSVLTDRFKGQRSELDCFAALKRSGGTLHEAEALLNNPKFKHKAIRIDPFPIIGNNDLRFYGVVERDDSETNALIVAILDVSGSMSEMKKYIARAILFLMVECLRKQYKNPTIKFIIHHDTAKFVEEKDFLRVKENGGTEGHTAFALVNELIEEKYNTDLWNVYVFYFSDGEDASVPKTAKEMKKMLDSGINYFGFANIKAANEDLNHTSTVDLIAHIKTNWPVNIKKTDKIEFIVGRDSFPFLAATINDKRHVQLVLKEFLAKNRRR